MTRPLPALVTTLSVHEAIGAEQSSWRFGRPTDTGPGRSACRTRRQRPRASPHRRPLTVSPSASASAVVNILRISSLSIDNDRREGRFSLSD